MTFTNFGQANIENMIRTVIIDDEAHIRETLSRLLAKFCPQVTLVGEANSVAGGFKLIHEINPQLVLLDIRMDDGTAFDLLKKFTTIDFKVIFITAYEKYAVQAFKFAAIDFLLKPVNPEELTGAVKHAETIIQQHFNTQLQVLEENLKSDIRQKKKIVLRTQENIYLVDLQDITDFESDRCYTLVHRSGGEQILISKTLKEFDDMLSESGFLRVHKSYLINLMHISRFEKHEGGYIILTNGRKIPVASRKREELMEMFEKL
jgi:two-component system, LytTR family, response regulator